MDREYLAQFESDRERERIFLQAQKMLSDLGLSIDEVVKKHRVLDVGASTAILEKAVGLKGDGKNFVSLSLEAPSQVKGKGLNFVVANASNTPFESGSFDLLISRNGPIYLTQTQFEADAILQEMLRVQSADGETRIYPIRFGFIKQQLFDQNPEYFNLHAKAASQRSIRDNQHLRNFNETANQRTLDYLQKEGIRFETGLGNNTEDSLPGYVTLFK